MVFQLLAAIGMIALYFLFYYMTGSLVLHILPVCGADDRLACRLILGFFVYQFFFMVVALPMKLTLQPLSRLSGVWVCCLIVLTVLFLIFECRQCVARLRAFCRMIAGKSDDLQTDRICSAAGLPQDTADTFNTNDGKEKNRPLSVSSGLQSVRRTRAALLILLAAALIQTVWFNFNDETYALWDQAYYIGDTASSVYTDTISQYNPYTGYQLESLNAEYLLETYQNHSAVMCQLFGIHPLIEIRTVMTSVVILIYQLIFYEIGMILFGRDKLKSAVMVCFLFLLNLFSYNLFTAGEFLIIRPFEGKTILAVLIIPSLFWLFLRTASDPVNRFYWCHTFLVILGSFGLNMSSVFMIPFEISAFYIPLAIRRKKLSIFLGYLVLLIPCIVFTAAYLITKHKITIYTGK